MVPLVIRRISSLKFFIQPIYKTKEMEMLKKSGLTTRSITSIEDLSTILSNMSSAASEESDDVVAEECDIKDLKVVAEMDKILDNCFSLVKMNSW